MCNGAGGCELYSAGTSCGPAACTNGSGALHSSMLSKACNGFGECLDGSKDCGLFKCSGSACALQCASSADCLDTAWCKLPDGICAYDLGLGSVCHDSTQCQSGICVDGVCCNAACDEPCMACKAAVKESGVEGICGPVAKNTDPDDDCDPDDTSTCGRDGMCNGSGGCELYKVGIACGATQCVSGTGAAHSTVTGKSCDGFGLCLESPKDCGLYDCSGSACAASCASPADCIEVAWCKLPGGTCDYDLAAGSGCQDPGQCQSGYCVDGVCCNAACTEPCMACSAALKASGADGMCGPVAKDTDPDGNCDPEDPATCGNSGACNGSGSCLLYKIGTSCGATTCENGTGAAHSTVAGWSCNGFGICLDSPKDCGLYGCSGSACALSCTSFDDCLDAAWCKLPEGACEADLALGLGCLVHRTLHGLHELAQGIWPGRDLWCHRQSRGPGRQLRTGRS
jgi:hypothetical protein